MADFLPSIMITDNKIRLAFQETASFGVWGSPYTRQGCWNRPPLSVIFPLGNRGDRFNVSRRSITSEGEQFSTDRLTTPRKSCYRSPGISTMTRLDKSGRLKFSRWKMKSTRG